MKRVISRVLLPSGSGWDAGGESHSRRPPLWSTSQLLLRTSQSRGPKLTAAQMTPKHLEISSTTFL